MYRFWPPVPPADDALENPGTDRRGPCQEEIYGSSAADKAVEEVQVCGPHTCVCGNYCSNGGCASWRESNFPQE